MDRKSIVYGAGQTLGVCVAISPIAGLFFPFLWTIFPAVFVVECALIVYYGVLKRREESVEQESEYMDTSMSG